MSVNPYESPQLLEEPTDEATVSVRLGQWTWPELLSLAAFSSPFVLIALSVVDDLYSFVIRALR
jgi:hypothetical protein